MTNFEPSDTLIKLSSRDLLLGMYITELDCLWSDTPFPVGGFHVKKGEDIQVLQKFCKTVYIDGTRGALPQKHKPDQLTILSSARKAAPESASIKVRRDTYPVTLTIKKHIDKAYKHYSALQDRFCSFSEAVRKQEKPALDSIEKSVDQLVEAVIVNSQTFVWLLNTDCSELHRSSYCVRAAVWSAVLARQIGMTRNDLKVVFLGTLMSDIGMCFLPERLLDKSGPYRKKEFLAYKKHVVLGVKFLTQYSHLDSRVISIVRSHHERHDGLGFPRGLRGKQIPTLARFANLAYCFERQLRFAKQGIGNSPANAMSRLYKQRELKFPDQLVVEFMHTMGMYPVGTVVELNSGELALVLQQNASERMSPRVGIVTNANQSLLKTPKIAELSKDDRMIITSTDVKQSQVDARKYTFSFSGKRLGIGGFGLRL